MLELPKLWTHTKILHTTELRLAPREQKQKRQLLGKRSNNFLGTGTNEPSHNNKQDSGTRLDEQNIERRRAVHEASNVDQDSRFEEWKRRMGK